MKKRQSFAVKSAVRPTSDGLLPVPGFPEWVYGPASGILAAMLVTKHDPNADAAVLASCAVVVMTVKNKGAANETIAFTFKEHGKAAMELVGPDQPELWDVAEAAMRDALKK
jgi:hypothetical protein